MRAMLAIARLSVLEALRSKVLITLALFVGGVLLISQFVDYLSLGAENKIFKDVCLGLSTLFVSILAVVLPIEQMRGEAARNSLAAVLSKPLHRYSFIAGKWLGMVAVLAMVSLGLGTLVAGLIFLRGVWDPAVCKAFALLTAQGVILVSCSLLLGVLFAGYFLAVLTGVAVYLLGNMLEPMRHWIEHAQSLAAKAIGMLILRLVPHLENLNVQDLVALGEGVPNAYVAENLLYAAAYSAVVLFLAAMAFHHKDF